MSRLADEVLPRIVLRPVDRANFEACIGLKVDPSQAAFVAEADALLVRPA